jgi:hypothetical protein
MVRLIGLTAYERRTYLRPARDLIWNITEMEELYREGMTLTLLGAHVRALEKRLHQTHNYYKKHGDRKLVIYLVGTFPIRPRTTATLDRLIGFTTTGTPNRMRSSDKHQLQRIEKEFRGTGMAFLMTLGAPISASKGLWYPVLDVPDATIDLRIYVPTFADRIYEQIKITFSNMIHMSGVTGVAGSALETARKRTTSLCWLINTCTGSYRLVEGFLTSFQVQVVERSALGQLLEIGDYAGLLLDYHCPLGSAIQPFQLPRIRFFLQLDFGSKTYSVIMFV